jgi:hypothetical protein
MAIIKKTNNNKCLGWEQGRTFLHCWWECKLFKPLWKSVWRFLKKKKLKIEFPFDPAIPLLNICPKESSQITVEIFISPSVDEWIKKMWYIYIMEFCSALKKNLCCLLENEWNRTSSR